MRERKCGFVLLDDLHALLLCSTLFVCFFLFLVVEDKGFGSDKELLEKGLGSDKELLLEKDLGIWVQTSIWVREKIWVLRKDLGFY